MVISKVIKRGDTHQIGRKDGAGRESGVGNMGRIWEEFKWRRAWTGQLPSLPPIELRVFLILFWSLFILLNTGSGYICHSNWRGTRSLDVL